MLLIPIRCIVNIGAKGQYYINKNNEQLDANQKHEGIQN